MKLACGANDPWYFRRKLRNILYDYYNQTTEDKILDEVIRHVAECEDDFKKDEVYEEVVDGKDKRDE
jgi:hypothetical protein